MKKRTNKQILEEETYTAIEFCKATYPNFNEYIPIMKKLAQAVPNSFFSDGQLNALIRLYELAAYGSKGVY